MNIVRIDTLTYLSFNKLAKSLALQRPITSSKIVYYHLNYLLIHLLQFHISHIHYGLLLSIVFSISFYIFKVTFSQYLKSIT